MHSWGGVVYSRHAAASLRAAEARGLDAVDRLASRESGQPERRSRERIGQQRTREGETTRDLDEAVGAEVAPAGRKRLAQVLLVVEEHELDPGPNREVVRQRLALPPLCWLPPSS